MSLLMRSLVRLNSPTFVALQQTHIVSVRKVKAAAATAAVRQSRYIYQWTMREIFNDSLSQN